MNAKKVLSKIVEFLSIEEVELTYAKLADGTIVESPTFDVGEKVEVIGEDGKKSPAPDGTHELSLKKEDGEENLIKIKTEGGIITERENVELADVETEEVKDIPQSGTYTEDDEVAEVPGGEMEGTFKGAEEGKEEEKEMSIVELGKKMEDMVYRIEEMEKKINEMETKKEEEKKEEKMEDEDEDEEMELPKLDGAPIDETNMAQFSEVNRKNYGKKIQNSQSSFLSKLYK